MAECSIKDIANRIKNIESTKKIVSAIELVSSSKMQKYKMRLKKIRPYSDSLDRFIRDICRDSIFERFICNNNNNVKNSCYITICGDRGLAGGYNLNVIKLVEKYLNSQDDLILPIGRKVLEYSQKKNLKILSDDFSICDKISFEDCKKISNMMINWRLNKKFNKIFLIYTEFISPLKQNSNIKRLFPVELEKSFGENKNRLNILCEQTYEECAKRAISCYISGTIWSAVCESLASEFSARHTAMESASRNAYEMLSDLRLKYNQLRQSAITQEITEIIAGSG